MQKGKYAKAAFLALLLISSQATSGTVEQANFEGQVQMRIEEGRVISCGVRVLGVVDINTHQQIMGVDSSVNVAKPGFGTVKGLVYQGTLDQYSKGDLQRLQLQSFWFRKPEDLTTVPRKGGYAESPETERAILYPTTVDSVFSILDAVVERQAIQIGFKITDEPYDRIFFGVVKMTDQEMVQLGQCLVDWANNMLQEMNTKNRKPKK